MTATCREGHPSTELDYCSVCGVAMGGAPPAGPATSGGGSGCPACGEPRADPDARFCEVCRYDFVQRKAGPPPAAAPAPAAPSPAPPKVVQPQVTAPAIPAPGAPVPASGGWELVVAVDPSLDTDPDPATPCPRDEPEHVFPIDLAELLVGRRDDHRDIRPEVPVSDPGTSRRHAKLVKNPDGSISLLDLASMNGSRLNGQDVAPGSRHALKEGDRITIGRWTSLQIRRRP